MNKKKVVVLGSTGSIGTQSLDVIRDRGYATAGLSAHSNIELLAKQALEFKPEYVALTREELKEDFMRLIEGCENPPIIFTGKNSVEKLVRECEADIVLNAIVGIAGLSATLASLECKTDVALANKESLVAGGSLVMETAGLNGRRIIPVDSEHSAIFQCIQDKHSAASIKKMILTASGGPFYGKSREELINIKKEQALKHPNWDMGVKITIDSATLMNKGLEFIEAMWLFNMRPDKIEIVVQRESIIHSMVEFADNSILAQLGVPDMRIPIQYALTWPERHEGIAPELDFKALSSLSFGTADEEVFRCLAACKMAAEKGGLAPCAANGANEEAVGLFLEDKISFLDIGRLVEACVNSDSFMGNYTLKDVYECDAYARRFVRENI